MRKVLWTILLLASLAGLTAQPTYAAPPKPTAQDLIEQGIAEARFVFRQVDVGTARGGVMRNWQAFLQKWWPGCEVVQPPEYVGPRPYVVIRQRVLVGIGRYAGLVGYAALFGSYLRRAQDYCRVYWWDAACGSPRG